MNIFNLLNKDEITKYTYIKNYSAGDIVFNEGEICNTLGMIEVGEVNVVEITYTEKEETITFLNTGSYFGDILLFSKNNIYLGHAICLKKTTIRYISKENLILLFKEHPNFLESYLMLISTKALNLKQETKLFKHKNITDRVIYYLNMLSKKEGSKKICIENVSSLAKILSLPRPSLSRELSNLEERNIITKFKDGKKTYIILKTL